MRSSKREDLKIALRTVLYRRNLDLVRHPFPVKVATCCEHIGVNTVIDVGANVGQFGSALRSAGFTGRIVSCEPIPDAFRDLSRRVGRDSRWTAVRTAVGAGMGTLEINVAANSYSSSALVVNSTHTSAAPDSRTVATTQAPMTTVAELIAEHDVDPARTLLKIDTQGFEGEVLDGAGPLLDRFGALQLELSLVSLYDGQPLARELTSRIEAAGFDLYILGDGFSDDRTGRTLQYDALFVRTP